MLWNATQFCVPAGETSVVLTMRGGRVPRKGRMSDLPGGRDCIGQNIPNWVEASGLSIPTRTVRRTP
jgi:hypothetical protein